MKEKTLRHMAELALIRAIPSLTVGDLKNGRLKGLFKRLVIAVDRDLVKLPRPEKTDLDIIWEKVERF